MASRHVYMMVTLDKYELPLAVADTAPELAEMVGVQVQTIYAAICRKKNQKKKIGSRAQTRYVKVRI